MSQKHKQHQLLSNAQRQAKRDTLKQSLRCAIANIENIANFRHTPDRPLQARHSQLRVCGHSFALNDCAKNRNRATMALEDRVHARCQSTAQPPHINRPKEFGAKNGLINSKEDNKGAVNKRLEE